MAAAFQTHAELEEDNMDESGPDEKGALNCSILDLSDYSLIHIFSYLNASDLYNLSSLCKRFEELVKEKKLWCIVDARDPPCTKDKVVFCICNVNERTRQLYLAGNSRCETIFRLAFLHTPYGRNLRVLALENQLISDLVALAHFPSTLEELSFRKSYISDFTLFFRNSDTNLHNLKVLILDQCGWVETSIMVPISKYPQLQILSLYMCKKLSDNDISYLSLAGCFGFKSLRILDARFTGLGDQLLKTFYKHKHLQELYFQSYTKTYKLEKTQRDLELAIGGNPKRHAYMSPYDNVPDMDLEMIRNFFGQHIYKTYNMQTVSDDGVIMYRLVQSNLQPEKAVTSLLYESPYGECKCGYYEPETETETSLVSSFVQAPGNKIAGDFEAKKSHIEKLEQAIAQERKAVYVAHLYMLKPKMRFDPHLATVNVNAYECEASPTNKVIDWLNVREPRNEYEVAMFEHTDLNEFLADLNYSDNIIIDFRRLRNEPANDREGELLDFDENGDYRGFMRDLAVQIDDDDVVTDEEMEQAYRDIMGDDVDTLNSESLDEEMKTTQETLESNEKDASSSDIEEDTCRSEDVADDVAPASYECSSGEFILGEEPNDGAFDKGSSLNVELNSEDTNDDINTDDLNVDKTRSDDTIVESDLLADVLDNSSDDEYILGLPANSEDVDSNVNGQESLDSLTAEDGKEKRPQRKQSDDKKKKKKPTMQNMHSTIHQMEKDMWQLIRQGQSALLSDSFKNKPGTAKSGGENQDSECESPCRAGSSRSDENNLVYPSCSKTRDQAGHDEPKTANGTGQSKDDRSSKGKRGPRKRPTTVKISIRFNDIKMPEPRASVPGKGCRYGAGKQTDKTARNNREQVVPRGSLRDVLGNPEEDGVEEFYDCLEGTMSGNPLSGRDSGSRTGTKTEHSKDTDRTEDSLQTSQETEGSGKTEGDAMQPLGLRVKIQEEYPSSDEDSVASGEIFVGNRFDWSNVKMPPNVRQFQDAIGYCNFFTRNAREDGADVPERSYEPSYPPSGNTFSSNNPTVKSDDQRTNETSALQESSSNVTVGMDEQIENELTEPSTNSKVFTGSTTSTNEENMDTSYGLERLSDVFCLSRQNMSRDNESVTVNFSDKSSITSAGDDRNRRNSSVLGDIDCCGLLHVDNDEDEATVDLQSKAEPKTKGADEDVPKSGKRKCDNFNADTAAKKKMKNDIRIHGGGPQILKGHCSYIEDILQAGPSGINCSQVLPYIQSVAHDSDDTNSSTESLQMNGDENAENDGPASRNREDQPGPSGDFESRTGSGLSMNRPQSLRSPSSVDSDFDRPQGGDQDSTTSIRKLSLRGYGKITDISLYYLSKLNLELLDVTQTNVTRRGISDFKLRNPECRIIHESTCVCRPRLHF